MTPRGAAAVPGARGRAVVLLSGGLDSTTTLGIALAEGWEAHALSFDYGQRHRLELERAAEIARAAGAASHRIVRVDLAAFGGSALTADIAVPKRGGPNVGRAIRGESETDRPSSPEPIPVTYVPARNTVFLAIALAHAETIGARDVFLGVNALDYSGYPDCRPEFLEAFERLANLGTKAGVESKDPWFRFHAPLLRMTKAAIVRQAVDLGVDLARTTSCYDPGPGGAPCGECDACVLRARGFAEAGVADPAAAATAAAASEGAAREAAATPEAAASPRGRDA